MRFFGFRRQWENKDASREPQSREASQTKANFRQLDRNITQNKQYCCGVLYVVGI